MPDRPKHSRRRTRLSNLRRRCFPTEQRLWRGHCTRISQCGASLEPRKSINGLRKRKATSQFSKTRVLINTRLLCENRAASGYSAQADNPLREHLIWRNAFPAAKAHYVRVNIAMEKRYEADEFWKNCDCNRDLRVHGIALLRLSSAVSRCRSRAPRRASVAR
jgi:hypothetical protein